MTYNVNESITLYVTLNHVLVLFYIAIYRYKSTYKSQLFSQEIIQENVTYCQ